MESEAATAGNRYRTTILVGFVATLLAALAQIGWDWYKSRTSIELEEISTTAIIDSTKMPSELSMSYDSVSIPDLTLVSVALRNAGTIPIREDDVVAYPSMTFPLGTQVLEARVDSVDPQGVEVMPQIPEQRRVEFRFRLLNPGDNAWFNVFLTGSPDFEAVARISGIRHLDVRRPTVEKDEDNIGLRLTLYALLPFALLSVVWVIPSYLIDVGREKHTKRLLKEGYLEIPRTGDKSEFRSYLHSVLNFRHSDKIGAIDKMIDRLPDDKVLNEKEASEIIAAFEELCDAPLSEGRFGQVIAMTIGMSITFLLYWWQL